MPSPITASTRRRFLTASVGILGASLASCSSPGDSKRTEQTLRDFYESMGSRDLDRLVGFFSDQCSFEDVPARLLGRGQEEIRAIFSTAYSEWSDLNVRVETIFAGERWACSEWTWAGRFSGEFLGTKQLLAGVQASLRIGSIIELGEGKISRITDYWDAWDVARQIGLLPQEGSPGNHS